MELSQVMPQCFLPIHFVAWQSDITTQDGNPHKTFVLLRMCREGGGGGGFGVSGDHKFALRLKSATSKLSSSLNAFTSVQLVLLLLLLLLHCLLQLHLSGSSGWSWSLQSVTSWCLVISRILI